jgi:CO/xanthine dehydrogenase FAD-binding subunit
MDLDTVTDYVPAPGTAWREGDAWLAGGTWLFSEPQPTTTRLLDLNSFGWPDLTIDEDGVEIAATCTLATLSRLRLPSHWPAGALIGQCCEALLGSFKIWNTASVGGNICLSLPAGPMTSLTTSLDATATIWSADGAIRELPVLDFVIGAGRNVLGPGDLLRSVHLPASSLRCRTAFRQLSLSTLGRSAAVVIGRLHADGGLVVTVSASTARPYQLRFAEVPDPARALAALEATVPEYFDDVHGQPAWRHQITSVLLSEICAELTA